MERREKIESRIIRAALGTPPEPPVDLFEIADNIGVRAILATEFRDGFTDFRPRRPVIYLNRTESGPRMRFILAHEISHVILRSPQARDVLEEYGQTALLEEEEELADRIAATILLPDSWLSALRRARYSLTGLENIAHTAEIPLTVLITRMSLMHIKVGLLHWLRGDSAWHLIDRPGVPFCLRGPFELSENGKRKLEGLKKIESIVTVDGHVDGWYVEITSPAWRRGSEVLQLIRPSCTTWHTSGQPGELRLGLVNVGQSRLQETPSPWLGSPGSRGVAVGYPPDCGRQAGGDFARLAR
jgi:hypothetical protein